MSTTAFKHHDKATCQICGGVINRGQGSGNERFFHSACKIAATSTKIGGQLPLPCETAYRRAVAIIDSCEGNSDFDRWDAIKKAMVNLPLVNAVQPNLNLKDKWTDEERWQWEDLAQEIGDADFVKRMATKKAFGMESIAELPIPNGHLTFDIHSSELVQQGHIGNRAVPLFDLGYLISSGETNGGLGSGFNDWKAFIQCLWAIGSGPYSEGSHHTTQSMQKSKTLVEGLYSIPGPWTANPFSAIHAWLSVEYSNGEHPFQVDHWLARNRLISFLGGPVVHAWERLLVGNEKETTRVVSNRGSLTCLKGELFLPIMRGNEIELIEVPLDLDLWRILITLTMYPYDTELGDLLLALGYCWERNRKAPNDANARSLRLLNSVMEAESDSMQVVDDYIVVEGQSGLGHRLKIISEQKIHIQSYRSMEVAMNPDPNEVYFEPCIDMKDSQPIGDMIVTYILTLRNDIETKNGVETLEPAVDIRLACKSVPTAVTWAKAMEAHYHAESNDWFEDDEYLEFNPMEVEGWDDEVGDVDEADEEPIFAGWSQSMIDEFLENIDRDER